MEHINRILDGNTSFSSTWTLIFIGISCISYLFYVNYVRPYNLFNKLGIKGPTPKILIGNILDSSNGLHDALMKYQRKYGRVYGTFIGTRPTLWIADPDTLKIIMVKDFHAFTDRVAFTNKLSPALRHSVLFSTGEDWRRIRNILTATFSASKLKQVFPIIDTICDRYVEKLLVMHENGENIDMKFMYGNLTLEVITAVAFGVRVDDKARISKLIDVVGELFKTVTIVRLAAILLPSLESFIRLFLWRRKKAVNYLTSTIMEIIHERRECLQNGTPCNRDLLQLMIEATENGKLSNDEIVGQSYIFMIAGYETSANTLTFATYLLATHPDIQDKLYREIAEKYEEKGVLDYDTISELQYLDMVLSETLRIYPSAYSVNRKVSKDTTINGIPIKKEMAIGIPIYGIHHDPEYWSDPEKFNPDRFTTEAKQARYPFTYMPFGAGPRSCIGMRLALIETKLTLAKLLRTVEFFVIDKTEIPLKVTSFATLTPLNGVYVGVKKRF